MGAVCPAQAAFTAWGRCSLVPGPGLMPAGRTSEQGTLMSFFTSVRAPTCRTGYCSLVSHVFSIFCLGFCIIIFYCCFAFFFFFYIHCSNNQCSKDFLRACCSCAEVTSRYTCEQSLTVLLQLQATGCEMSSVLRLVPLNVKKTKHHLILCRATAVFFKDSKTWFEVLHCAPYENKVILFLSFLRCFACAWTCFEDYLPQEEQKKAQSKCCLCCLPHHQFICCEDHQMLSELPVILAVIFIAGAICSTEGIKSASVSHWFLNAFILDLP